jgi:hypothetical protein
MSTLLKASLRCTMFYEDFHYNTCDILCDKLILAKLQKPILMKAIVSSRLCRFIV